ncbi:MAG: TetR/AcrR family transcriptional regulator C-terminal domain-containing protein [Solirubrobacterales bacterium]
MSDAHGELSPAEHELLARRREIADAAIAIADEQGIEAVSMRNIAARIGVGTMTLYTWVEGKDDLIAAMSNELAAQMLVPEPLPSDWRAALTAIAFATRDVFAHHPWMLSPARPMGPIGANMLRHVDQSLRAVRELELDWELRGAVLRAVDHYALGYAVSNQRRQLREAAHAERDSDPDYGEAFAKVSRSRAARIRGEAPQSRADQAGAIELRELFAGGDAPALTEYFGSAESALERIRQGPPPIENAFELGLEWLLDGVEQMLAERAAR